MENVKVKVDKQEEFLASEVCLFQMTTGDKFIPGLIAVTGTQILIFNDFAPSEKIGDLYVYHPVFMIEFSSIKLLTLSKLVGNDELRQYIELDIVETCTQKNEQDKNVVVYFEKKKAKHYKKVIKNLEKVGKLKIKKNERDCSIYN